MSSQEFNKNDMFRYVPGSALVSILVNMFQKMALKSDLWSQNNDYDWYEELNLNEVFFVTKLTKTNPDGLKYKDRWGIEKFIRWIKQSLKIKTFVDRSENAVLS